MWCLRCLLYVQFLLPDLGVHPEPREESIGIFFVVNGSDLCSQTATELQYRTTLCRLVWNISVEYIPRFHASSCSVHSKDALFRIAYPSNCIEEGKCHTCGIEDPSHVCIEFQQI